MITLDGVMTFCKELDIDGETDVIVLYIAYHMKAKGIFFIYHPFYLKELSRIK